jgi:hypothetical protein
MSLYAEAIAIFGELDKEFNPYSDEFRQSVFHEWSSDRDLNSWMLAVFPRDYDDIDPYVVPITTELLDRLQLAIRKPVGAEDNWTGDEWRSAETLKFIEAARVALNSGRNVYYIASW